MSCEKCKKSGEVELKTQPYTEEEYRNILPLLDKYGLTNQETQYIYNFYNRVFNMKRSPGCGKCTVNVIKSLKNKYNELYNQ